MTTKTEALKLALHDIERYQTKRQDFDRFENTVIKIKEALAQPDLTDVERNFCPRCGKRLHDALGPVSIHTCCPPNGRTFDDYGNKIA